LLIAIGAGKAEAIRDTVEGPLTSQITASALQLHREVIVVVDEAAAGLLARKDYYAEVEHAQSLLEAGDFRALGIGKHA
jgi:glucosamine-6-phosphate deaminase